MPGSASLPLPAAHALRKLGRDLALARRKRGIATADMAARLFVSRDTLWRLERGDPTIALGTLATAAFILQLHDRLGNLAAPATDTLALSLDERRLPQRIRRVLAVSVEVHIDWEGTTHLVGRLHPAERSPSVSFLYAPEWLGRADRFAIDPTSLPLEPGPLHGLALFGAMHDCGPDRWGRLLIERAVRKHLLERKPYQELDYVLALDDSSRLGALRFRADAGGPFLAIGSGKLPPLVRLSALLRATEAIAGETETAEDLRFLLGAGSPLGGARPKAAVSLADGRLAIAKFPKPDDVRDIAAGEILSLTLARQAGLTVAEHRRVEIGHQSVSVITRFDRAGPRRIPFLSGHSLLGLPPGEPPRLHGAGRCHSPIWRCDRRRSARVVAEVGLFTPRQQLRRPPAQPRFPDAGRRALGPVPRLRPESGPGDRPGPDAEDPHHRGSGNPHH